MPVGSDEEPLSPTGRTAGIPPLNHVDSPPQPRTIGISTVVNSESPLPPGTIGISPVQQMIASSTGAVVTSVFVTPLDVIKIRLQAQAKPSAFSKGHCFLYCNGLMDHLCACVEGISRSSEWYKRPTPNVKFKGSIDAAMHIAKHEGITSLWSGLSPTLVMAVPATVVYFTCYEQMKDLFGYKLHDNSLENRWKPMGAGVVARVWASTLISPVEMIRVKVQSEQYSYSQVWQALKETIRTNGFQSMWRGLGPSLLRDVPFSALYWTGYEIFKARFLLAKGTTVPTFFESFASGAVSGAIASVVTLPFDVIKTRRQIELGEMALLGSKNVPSSTWKLIQRIYTQEGVSQLYSGLLPRVLKVAPSCAIMISSYEFFKHFFSCQNLRASNGEALVKS